MESLPTHSSRLHFSRTSEGDMPFSAMPFRSVLVTAIKKGSGNAFIRNVADGEKQLVVVDQEVVIESAPPICLAGSSLAAMSTRVFPGSGGKALGRKLI